MTSQVLHFTDEFNDSHRFLSEELLQPMTNKTDSSRTVLWTNHFIQSVIINKPEIPRIFTRYENKIGSYSTAIKGTPENIKVIDIYEKNSLKNVYIFEDENGIVDIHFASPVQHLTESYGYQKDNSPLKDIEKGDTIEKGSLIQSWNCNDEFGNFKYGANFKTIYTNMNGLTYEDGVVISETTSKRLSHTSIKEYESVFNLNTLFVNLYGNENEFKGFPDIGEEIKNGILFARRRINNDTILHDLSNKQMFSPIINGNDSIYYATGKVVDIEIYSNLDLDYLKDYSFNEQVVKYQSKDEEFKKWIINTLEPYINNINGTGYTEEAAYWYNFAKRTLEEKWFYNKKQFTGVVFKFTIAEEHPAQVGSKLTNRYGGKGVVSAIWKDEDMPLAENGERAEIILNSLAIINRLNPSQLFEAELNFIADEVTKQMIKKDSLLDAWNLYIDFIALVSPKQAEWLLKEVDTDELKSVYTEEIINGDVPIRIYQAPFWGNISLETLSEAYSRFNVKRLNFIGFEEPMILGTNYIIKLRHEPFSKFSARSAKHLSINNIPIKNNIGYKKGTEKYSSTPIRLGEQETENLLILNKSKDLKRFFNVYALDENSRKSAIEDLLTKAPFDRKKIKNPSEDIPSTTINGLNVFLNSLGLNLTK